MLLDNLPAPRLQANSTYTVIAEKFRTIVLLGMTMSPLAKYFNLSELLQCEILKTELLTRAIKATAMTTYSYQRHVPFIRRNTPFDE